MPHPKFIINKNSKGSYRFNLTAKNGQTIVTSESYKSLSGCKNGVKSVQKNAKLKSRFERKESKNGKYYFNLKAGNHQVIGTSEMYNSSASCENGIQSVVENGPRAAIEK